MTEQLDDYPAASLTELNTRVSVLKSQIERAKQEFLEHSGTLIAEAAKPIFDKYPWLESFGWLSFVPSFNDGDACLYTLEADEPFINDWGREACYGDLDVADPEKELADANTTKEEIKIASDEITNFVYNSLGSDLLESLEHGHTTLHRDGRMTTEYYDYY